MAIDVKTDIHLTINEENVTIEQFAGFNKP